MTTKVEIQNKGPDKVKVRVIGINPEVPAVEAAEGVEAQAAKPAEHVVRQEQDLAVEDRVGFYVHDGQYLSLSEVK